MKIEIEESALDSLKAMTQKLQDERDELLGALVECADRLQIHMLHTEDLIAHMRAWKIIAKCTAKPEVM